MSDFGGNLPQLFIRFRVLNGRAQLHQEEQTGGNQLEPIFPPICFPILLKSQQVNVPASKDANRVKKSASYSTD